MQALRDVLPGKTIESSEVLNMEIKESSAEALLAKLEVEVRTLFKKVDKMETLVETVATLASDVRVLAEQIKQQNGMFEVIINKYDDRLKTQGERIGLTPTLNDFKELLSKVDELEKKPARKAETVAAKILQYLAVAIIAYFTYTIFGL